MKKSWAGLLLVLAACGPSSGPALPPSGSSDLRFEIPSWSGAWYKGNTHAHTLESDGDASPEYVARWYKDHGYNFLVLSDHNVFTDPVTLSHIVDSTFLLIPGEEVTSSFEDASVHVNGLNLPGLVQARTAETLVGTIQANVDAIREVEGVPHINHPNFRWSFGIDELRQIERDRLLEIWNGHPTVHNEGGGGIESMEEVWDLLVTGGKRIYGIAVDDAHHFVGEFSPDRANPGRGWVAVRAGALEAPALMSALEAGHFYASTGVVLDDIVVKPRSLEVFIGTRGDFRYTTTFIGSSGRILHESVANPAVFELERDEGYVRARVVDSGGNLAWTQPIFVSRR
ncbi:MAG: CehA/McbA family metallohydrolase [Gemmatimonadetes bacterium]|nr:CehA/McbA family metallohydrolase [Gemmatimonadota bacterium]MDA1102024.1 CehA/McbA family metallohydrolase [Gemmatimonadota bacterium]